MPPPLVATFTYRTAILLIGIVIVGHPAVLPAPVPVVNCVNVVPSVEVEMTYALPDDPEEDDLNVSVPAPAAK